MEKIEKREVAIKYCDFCRDEVETLERCAICKSNICPSKGYTKHFEYSLTIYRYSDGVRLPPFRSHICKRCAGKNWTSHNTVRQLMDLMIDK